MKKFFKIGAIVLMMSLLATGCAGSTGNVDSNVGNIADGQLSAEEQAAIEAEMAAREEAEKNAAQNEANSQQTEAQETAVQTTAPVNNQQVSNDAIVDGTLLQHYDSSYIIADYDSANGWIIFCDADGKGFGTPYNAVNVKTGMTIYGEEGAEVYFCPDGILQLEWRYQASGNPTSAENVLLYYPQISGDPKTFDLYLIRYDFDGNKLGEEFVMSYTQKEEYSYSEVANAQTPVLDSYGAIYPSYSYGYYSFIADGEDAVAYDENGNEVVRYPGKASEADGMFGMVMDNIVCVSTMFWPSFTDVYELN